MIHCNLTTLLAQRNLKISKVFQDTGISRTTLTALAYNHAQGIQFDTLNTLCTYLKVSPADLILHVPVDVSWTKEWYAETGTDGRYYTVTLTIKERGKEKQYPMCLKTFRYMDEKPRCEIILSFEAPPEEPDMPVVSAADAKKCIEIIDALPVECIADLVNRMIKDFSAPDLEDNAVSFSWPFHTGW